MVTDYKGGLKMTNDNPLVSVIVPAYNVAPYIRKCLTSIQAQTYKNLEIIVINDGSTDETGPIVKKIADKDIRIVYKEQENHGVSYTRNLGLEESHGEYIVWVDSDDYIKDNLVESLVKKFTQTDADIIAFGYQCFQGKITIGKAVIPPVMKNADDWFRFAVLDYISMVYTYSAKAEIWEGISFLSNRTHMGEDGAATIEVFRKAKKISVIPECFYYYNKGNDSALTRQVSADVFYELMESWIDREKICEEHFTESCAYCMQRVLTYAVKTYCFSLAGLAISDERKKRAEQILNEMDCSIIRGRFRDKFLRWAAVHKMDWICRYYGLKKYRKMLAKNMIRK